MAHWSTMLKVKPEAVFAAVLARRFLTASENRFARFVTWISFSGLALGVMVLTVVITVMNGFDSQLKDRLLRSIPHITIADAGADSEVLDEIRELSEVISVHDYFQGLAAISVGSQVQPVSLYGVDSTGVGVMDYLAQTMPQGNLQNLMNDPMGLVMGQPLARYLGLQMGDPVVVLTVKNGPQGIAPKLMRFTLAGTFELGAEPDYSLVIVNLARESAAVWQTLGTRGQQVQLQDPLNAPRLAQFIKTRLPQRDVDSWDSTYGELFQAVRLEKSMMFILLLLVVAIASFNIIAGQTMMVNDKRATIAILRTMGAKTELIRSVFLLQGVCVGVFGTFVGLLLGLVCAFNINAIVSWVGELTGRHLLDGSFFVEVPVLVLPQDLVLVAVMSCTMCVISAWFPARRAASLDPVQGLH